MDKLIVPWSGQQIDQTPAEVAKALHEWNQLKDKVREFEVAAQAYLLEAMDERGQYSLRFGDIHVEGSTPGDDYFYDPEVTRELLDAGLPEDRFAELVKVKVEERVDRRVAKSIAKVPKYAEVLERARRVVPKRRRVTFK